MIAVVNNRPLTYGVRQVLMQIVPEGAEPLKRITRRNKRGIKVVFVGTYKEGDTQRKQALHLQGQRTFRRVYQDQF